MRLSVIQFVCSQRCVHLNHLCFKAAANCSPIRCYPIFLSCTLTWIKGYIFHFLERAMSTLYNNLNSNAICCTSHHHYLNEFCWDHTHFDIGRINSAVWILYGISQLVARMSYLDSAFDRPLFLHLQQFVFLYPCIGMCPIFSYFFFKKKLLKRTPYVVISCIKLRRH